MNLLYNWDFIQNNIPPEKLAEIDVREESGKDNSACTKRTVRILYCEFLQ